MQTTSKVTIAIEISTLVPFFIKYSEPLQSCNVKCLTILIIQWCIVNATSGRHLWAGPSLW